MANKLSATGGTDLADNDYISGADWVDTLDSILSIGSNGNPTQPPVGSVVAWLKSLAGVPSTLPSGWVEADGSTVSDAASPLNGTTLPDLNGSSGTQRFLRGSTTSGTEGGSETHDHTVTPNAGTAYNTGSTNTPAAHSAVTSATASTLPSYHEVVWIIRIK